MPGTNFEHVWQLQERLERAKDMDLSEQELETYIEDCVESYWRHPENVAAREQTKDTPLSDRGIDPELIVDLATDLDETFESLKGWARLDKGAFRNLKHAVANRIDNGENSEEFREFTSSLLRSDPPKHQGNRRSPGNYHRDLQLKLAVGAVLKSELGRSTNEAIADVAAVTDIEDPSVKKAWYSLP